jgi:hypothetical protein
MAKVKKILYSGRTQSQATLTVRYSAAEVTFKGAALGKSGSRISKTARPLAARQCGSLLLFSLVLEKSNAVRYLIVSLLEHWQHPLAPQASYLLGSYIYERPMIAIGRNLALKA